MSESFYELTKEGDVHNLTLKQKNELPFIWSFM